MRHPRSVGEKQVRKIIRILYFRGGLLTKNRGRYTLCVHRLRNKRQPKLHRIYCFTDHESPIRAARLRRNIAITVRKVQGSDFVFGDRHRVESQERMAQCQRII